MDSPARSREHHYNITSYHSRAATVTSGGWTRRPLGLYPVPNYIFWPYTDDIPNGRNGRNQTDWIASRTAITVKSAVAR